MSSRQKFEDAKLLIEQKKYNEARALLQSINHPMALDWIDRIDKLQYGDRPPQQLTAQPIPPIPEHAPDRQPRRRNWLLLGCVIPSLVVCCTLGALANFGSTLKGTPTITPTPSITRTPSITFTPSITSTPSMTYTVTATSTATPTVPLAQLTKAAAAQTAVVNAAATKNAPQVVHDLIQQALNKNDVIVLNVDSSLIRVQIQLSDLSPEFAINDARGSFPKMACALRNGGFIKQDYEFRGMVPVSDALGNKSSDIGVSAIINSKVIAQLNCDNIDLINIQAVADSYIINPILEK